MSAGRIERRVEQLMGMPINLALRGPLATGARADRAWESILEQLREVDRTFSTYREDSVISRLGRGEIGLADCPPELSTYVVPGRVVGSSSIPAASLRVGRSHARRWYSRIWSAPIHACPRGATWSAVLG
jgi:thiamine biosynthesis lipoprotein